MEICAKVDALRDLSIVKQAEILRVLAPERIPLVKEVSFEAAGGVVCDLYGRRLGEPTESRTQIATRFF